MAQIVSSVIQDEEMITAAWLHDIVEDTSVTIGNVVRMSGAKVAGLVAELTFVSPPTHGNRAVRFAFEKEHFAKASAAAKTVKLADLIDTSRDLYKNDPASLNGYAAEANELAHVLDGGDESLLARLKRDLREFTADPLPAKSVAAVAPLRPSAFPVGILRMLERAFTAQDIAEPLIPSIAAAQRMMSSKP